VELRILSLLVLFMTTSCSSTPPKKDGAQDLKPFVPGLSTSGDSSVDIQYVLGRDHYRFHALIQGDLAMANTYLDRQVLDEGSVDKNQYSDFLKKAYGFINSSKRTPGPTDQIQCRSPFTVTVKIREETHITHGCRSSDDGALSKLVKDGEFLLLYSKN